MIKNLRMLTLVVTAMVAIDAAITPIILIWARIDQPGLLELIGRSGTELDMATIGFRILTIIAFSRWLYVAGRNVEEAGLDLEFTAGSRIWWFFIPFANLVKPFQGMRELWNASHGETPYDTNSAVIGVWWTLWLVTNIGYTILNKLSGPDTGPAPVWLLSAGDVLLAVFAIQMLRGIAAAQGRMLSGDGLNEVFA